MIRLSSQTKKDFDRNFFVVVLLLTSLGVVAVADSSAPFALRNFSDKFFFAKQQLFWALVGFFCLLISAHLYYKIWEKFAFYLFLISLLLTASVFIPSVGERLLGARRWIVIGPFNLQPSEFLKLSLAIYMARLASKGKKLSSLLLPIIVSLVLVILQPDLGTSIIIASMSLSQLFISEVRIIELLFASAIGTIGAFLLVITSPYRRERLLTFLNQEKNPLGSGYHIRQILLALGSGGLFGVGLGQSRQKYLFLPETATDSIFAVIAEEVGFLGGIIIILLFLWLVFRGLKIAANAPDKFSQILSIGIISWIATQIILNIGSMVALVPLTGVPLPFLSYGGSSLLSLMIACGIVLNISRYAK